MTPEEKQLLWRSLDETPVFPSSYREPLCSILVLYDNGNMFLYRYTKYGIPNDIGTPHFKDIIDAKWCYCNDLIPQIMTQKEKKLLLKDLSARLLYGVNGLITFHKTMGENSTFKSVIDGKLYDRFANLQDSWYDNIPSIKPYLRPMSSMTDEEKEELRQEHVKDEKLYAECLTMAANGDDSLRGKVIPHFAADWCNKNHFDYRGLIPMGLAIEAKKGMYKTE